MPTVTGTQCGSGADPIDVDDMNPSGSITESFTAALAQHAADSGLIRPGPACRQAGRGTVVRRGRARPYRQLREHTAGIPHHRALPEWVADPRAIDGRQPLPSAAHRAGLRFEPGADHEHSSSDRVAVNGPGPAEPSSGTAGRDPSIDEAVPVGDRDVARSCRARRSDRGRTHPHFPVVDVGSRTIGLRPVGRNPSARRASAIGCHGGSITVKYYERWDAIVVLV